MKSSPVDSRAKDQKCSDASETDSAATFRFLVNTRYMGIELVVSETSEHFYTSTRLSARENFTELYLFIINQQMHVNLTHVRVLKCFISCT
jgi:hypothetical protein